MSITHPVQLSIMRELLFIQKARFAELNVTGITNDHFTFHLKQLIKTGIIQKAGEEYKLTVKGLEIAGRLDAKTDEIIKQPKIGVSIFVCRKRDGILEILLGERQKDQSKGEIGWFTEKVRFGEPVGKTLDRCLYQETGLKAQFEYVGVERFIRREKKVIEVDVILLCFRAIRLSGDLKEQTNESRNFWISIAEARSLPNTFAHFTQILDLFLTGTVPYHEHVLLR